MVEVINEVSILSGEELQAPANWRCFSAPDLLQTGRRSRARLEAMTVQLPELARTRCSHLMKRPARST